MARLKRRLTDRFLKTLNPPTERTIIKDTETRGLEIDVQPTGTMTWRLVRRIGGRKRWVTIGRYPGVTPTMATNEADRLNGQIDLGNDPTRDKTDTLENLWVQFDRNHVSGLKERTRREYRRQWEGYLKAWGRDRTIGEITPLDIRQLATDIREGKGVPSRVYPNGRIVKGKGGGYMANRIIALLRSMFNWAYASDIHTGRNPCDKIKRYKEINRKRLMSKEELEAFFSAVMAEPNRTARDFFLCSVFIGARKLDILSMRWVDLDLPSRLWHLPDPKGDPYTIPLPDVATKVLLERYTIKEAKLSQWVFPGPGKSGHYIEPKSAWKRIRSAAGIHDMRIHDIRRTLGTWIVKTGGDIAEAQRILGHKDIATTKKYIHLDPDDVRPALERTTDAFIGFLPKDD